MPCGVGGDAWDEKLQAATAVQVPRLLRNTSRVFDPGPPSVSVHGHSLVAAPARLSASVSCLVRATGNQMAQRGQGLG